MSSFIKIFYISCIAVGSLILIITLVQNKFNKSTNTSELIPNVVHYILFNRNEITFIHYLSILSVFKIQQPLYILIHCNLNLTGYYWHKILNLTKSKSNSLLSIVKTTPPTHVYGQALSSIHHASDVTRIHILLEYGGIYLDNDVFILNNLNKTLRKYNAVVGWPEGQFIGSQLIMAEPGSKFLELWQLGYKRYKSRDWYYNAGMYPSEILGKEPSLAHREPVLFGVHYLLHKLLSNDTWNDWKDYYGIHVLYRHNDLMKNLNESTVMTLENNFGKICRFIINHE